MYLYFKKTRNRTKMKLVSLQQTVPDPCIWEPSSWKNSLPHLIRRSIFTKMLLLCVIVTYQCSYIFMFLNNCELRVFEKNNNPGDIINK